jgi:hypothetical protein
MILISNLKGDEKGQYYLDITCRDFRRHYFAFDTLDELRKIHKQLNLFLRKDSLSTFTSEMIISNSGGMNINTKYSNNILSFDPFEEAKRQGRTNQ